MSFIGENLTVVSSATSTDGALTTTDALRGVLMTTSTASEAYWQASIVRASSWARTYLGYPILLQRYREAVPAYGNQRLMLGVTPVTRVIAVFDATSTDSATSYTSTQVALENGDLGYLRRSPQGFQWTALVDQQIAYGVPPQTEQQNWLVDYWAGYAGPGGMTSTAWGATSTSSTVPGDLELAVLYKASKYATGGGNLDIVIQKVGDLQITHQTGGGGGGQAYIPIPEQLLMPFRRMGI